MKSRSRWSQARQTVVFRPDPCDLDADIDPLRLEQPDRREERRMILSLDQRSRDDDAKRRHVRSAPRRVEDLNVDTAWLNSYAPRRNIDLVELLGDGRTNSDQVRRQSVQETNAVQDAGREASVKCEDRRHAEHAYGAGGEGLKIITVKVREAGLSPVAHDVSDSSDQKETRDERARKRLHESSGIQYGRRFETPVSLATHPIQQPHTMAFPDLPPAKLADVYLSAAW
jgi:hypothetical protein